MVKAKTYTVAPSPLESGDLPNIIGGKCEFSGGQWNDEEQCPWFVGLHYNQEGERRPDTYSGNLTGVRAKLIETKIIKIEKVKGKAAKIEAKTEEVAAPKVEKEEESKDDKKGDDSVV